MNEWRLFRCGVGLAAFLALTSCKTVPDVSEENIRGSLSVWGHPRTPSFAAFLLKDEHLLLKRFKGRVTETWRTKLGEADFVKMSTLWEKSVHEEKTEADDPRLADGTRVQVTFKAEGEALELERGPIHVRSLKGAGENVAVLVNMINDLAPAQFELF